jgi:hypothetical protein
MIPLFSPDANKFNVDIDRKRFLEIAAESKVCLVLVRVHLVCEWKLLAVVRR